MTNSLAKITSKGLTLLFSAISLISISQTPGINLSYIDSAFSPRQDFYNFCNGKWQKKFVLPESDARYASFNEINENNLKKIKLILDAAAKNKMAKSGSDAQRLRDFYNTAMDSSRADALGYSPIYDQLRRIDSVKTIEQMMELKSEFDYIGVNLFFAGGVSPDLKNSKRNRYGISQAGLGLGDRDYYYNPKHEKIREEYKKYLENLFTLIGTAPYLAAEFANDVFEFEKLLANKALTREQMRDVEKQYNIYTIKGLNELAPVVKWDSYFKSKKINVDSVNVATVDFMNAMSKLVSGEIISKLKVYAKAQLIMEAAPYLSQKFDFIHFSFRGKIMSGAKKMKPRWQKVQSVMNSCIGDIVSKEFVKQHFTPDAKVKVNKLIDNLVLAYRERIAGRDWMSEETKKAANRKLDLLIRKVGYPDKWKDYTGMIIGTDSYWGNLCRANTFLNQDNLNDLKKPVDRNKWQMTPVTVNAYYDPTTNEITFPAAILQPPFFDPKAEDAANYGTMGSIIGHELTHGFDDQGAQFDADGNMKMWWTDNDYKNFKEKTGLIVKQFDEYVALDSLHVNGNMTQGENIADLGGLTMAYNAYKKSLNGSASKIIGGFTGEQRFFIAWAQGWKSVTRNEELKRLLTIDYHSPAYFRAFAPLCNMKAFYEAFGVKEGDKMYRPDASRVEIW
ncbi:MAG: M13 family metallopeptidase [Bacteroidia bacterium]|nr:M13 family metallopeptidase [Bacteroidia bacterium]